MNKSFNVLALTSLATIAIAAAPAFALSSTNPNAASTPDNGSEQPVTDTWITTKVKSELAVTDGVKSMEIEVTTVDGVVSLTGVLGSETAVKKAVAAAQSVKGVKRVDASGLK
jgi:hyperosmotically inducible protein